MTANNRLTPLLAPRSIALVGGSPREGSVGNLMVQSLTKGGYSGTMTVVNPRYDSVGGLPCVDSVAGLDEPPDLAILSVAGHRMEKTMTEAIKASAGSAVIFDPCFYEGDSEPRLLDRLKSLASEADFPVCGGNGMGYFNYDRHIFASFMSPAETTPGRIAALCHSGSVFAILALADPRYRFNLLTSQGQEIGASVSDYMDYALDQPSTRVLALFLETVRDPDGFVAALEKANRLKIPVVATKVGRTQESARLAATHSGALAGDDDAFDAVCRRYGVLRTDDLDSLMASAQILEMNQTLGEGGFAAMLDSGGLREQMMDLAHDLGLEFAKLTPETVQRLRERMAFGLEPVNPLDAAGPLDENFESHMIDALHTLDADPNVAMVAHELFATDLGAYSPQVLEAAKQMPTRSAKPYVLTFSIGTVRNAAFAGEMTENGIPVINGVRSLLVGVKNAFDYRDFRKREDESPVAIESTNLEHWGSRLESGELMGESEGLQMLNDLGVPSVKSRICCNREDAVELAEKIGYPVVVKTAADGIIHKSDVAGVALGLSTADEVRTAYDRLSELGPEVCVARTAPAGVEVAFGMINDPQFGPIVMVGSGGVLVEVLEDRLFVVPPFGVTEATRLLSGLRIWELLQGVRGSPPCDLQSLSLSLSQFSSLCAELGDLISEMDINPVITSADGALAVDTSITLVHTATFATATVINPQAPARRHRGDPTSR